MNREFLAPISFVCTVRRGGARELSNPREGFPVRWSPHPRESLRRIPVWFQSLGNSSSSVPPSLPLRSSFSPRLSMNSRGEIFYDRSPTLNLPYRFFCAYESVSLDREQPVILRTNFVHENREFSIRYHATRFSDFSQANRPPI